MTMRLKVIILITLIIGLCAIVNLIRKRALELKYAITWLVLDFGLVLIVWIPGLIDWISEVLGIYDVTNMVFFVGFVFSIIIIFTLTMSLSRNSDRIRKLAQRMALNEYAEKKDEK